MSILAFMPTCYQGLSRMVSQLPLLVGQFQVNMRFEKKLNIKLSINNNNNNKNVFSNTIHM